MHMRVILSSVCESYMLAILFGYHAHYNKNITQKKKNKGWTEKGLENKVFETVFAITNSTKEKQGISLTEGLVEN